MALSTMWFQRWPDQRDLTPFFEAGRNMGFSRFELSHILAPETVAAIVPGQVEIPTVHHACPRPSGLRAQDSLIAANPEARARAGLAMQVTIQTAERLGSRSVVMHLGKAEDDARGSFRRLRFEIEARWRAGQSRSARYRELLEQAKAWLRQNEPAQLERAITALPALIEAASAAGLRIGFETGYHPHELPTPSGMRWLISELNTLGFDSRSVGAWLDTGHVAARERIGLDGFEAWFDAVDGRWIGVHLHDAVGLRDHLVPGMGELDFAWLAAEMPTEMDRSCELDWYFSEEEISAGITHLKRAGWR